MASKRLTAVSLFTGAGGLDYGFEAAGYETRAAVEFDHNCCETLRMNRPWTVLEGDIHQTSSETILAAARLKPGDVDVLIGGPPCQPFSKAGYWLRGDSRRLDDPRADTLAAYMRCVRDLAPRAFLLENVHGISYSGKEEGLQLIVDLTKAINSKLGAHYVLSWKVLNAAEFGVPQLRRRFFLVASRDGRMFEFPNPTHGELKQARGHGRFPRQSDDVLPYLTSWDALAGCAATDEDLAVRGKWADLLPSIPEGENYLWHTNRGGGRPLFGWRTRYWSFLLKLAKNQPAWTIQAQPGPAIGPFHWANRRLASAEMARLQTFPAGLRFAGGRNAAQKQLGNAVPSLLAEILAREISRQLLDVAPPKTPRLQIKYSRPIPPAEPVAPVPRMYLRLSGAHADHPGTGKGPAGALFGHA